MIVSVSAAYLKCRSGYVAVAVSGPQGQVTREAQTGSNDRSENMVAFAGETLKLLRDVLSQAQTPSL
jgi:hypothetical protein